MINDSFVFIILLFFLSLIGEKSMSEKNRACRAQLGLNPLNFAGPSQQFDAKRRHSEQP